MIPRKVTGKEMNKQQTSKFMKDILGSIYKQSLV